MVEGLGVVTAELEDELQSGSRREAVEVVGKYREDQAEGETFPKNGPALCSEGLPGDDCDVPKRGTPQGSEH